jgi:hypothetical protein
MIFPKRLLIIGLIPRASPTLVADEMNLLERKFHASLEESGCESAHSPSGCGDLAKCR